MSTRCCLQSLATTTDNRRVQAYVLRSHAFVGVVRVSPLTSLLVIVDGDVGVDFGRERERSMQRDD